MEGFLRGIHRSPFHGFSAEFTEYRQYIPGEDTKYLDWRLYARSDRFYIKKFEDETNLRCHLLVDRSRSMAYGRKEYSKSEFAATLAATLAYFLNQQGDAVGLATFDAKVTDYLPARNRPGHLRRLMLLLEGAPEGEGTNLIAPLEHMARILSRRGVVVLLSDLLAPLGQLEERFGYLRSRGHEVLVFQILDRAELDLDLGGPALLEDMESGRDLFIDPRVAGPRYRAKLEEHLEGIREICATQGIQYHLFPSDQPLELALMEFLNSRTRRGRMAKLN